MESKLSRKDATAIRSAAHQRAAWLQRQIYERMVDELERKAAELGIEVALQEAAVQAAAERAIDAQRAVF